jgi:cytochrome c
MQRHVEAAEVDHPRTACAVNGIEGSGVRHARSGCSKRRRGDASAPAKLAEKVKKGGSGVWGPVPMPPNANVKDDDVKKMVELILALKK